jgi:hypothetical protein
MHGFHKSVGRQNKVMAGLGRQASRIVLETKPTHRGQGREEAGDQVVFVGPWAGGHAPHCPASLL